MPRLTYHNCFLLKPFPPIIRGVVFFCLCIALVTTACKKTKTAAPEVEKKETAEKTLLIGLIPEQNIFDQLQRYEPLAGYIAKKTGIIIKLKTLTRYGDIIDNFVSEGLDGAFWGSFTYTLAHHKLGVIPLVRPEDADGVSSYYGLIFVRKDSNITSARNMMGRVFAFVDKATTAGYIFPMAYFKENGINDYKSYFKETYFTGTHEDAVYDVLEKRADIGAAKNTVYSRIEAADPRIKKELVVLARSPDVPENGLALSKDIDPSTVGSLKEAFLNMHNDPEGREVLKKFGAVRFIETTDKDYEAVYRYAEKINLDLPSYNYKNGQ